MQAQIAKAHSYRYLTLKWTVCCRKANSNFGRCVSPTVRAIAKIASATGNTVTVDNVNYLMEGMVIDIMHSGSVISGYGGRRITNINRSTKVVTFDGASITSGDIVANDIITIQGSYNQELTGLDAIFDSTVTTLYGVTRSGSDFLKPYTSTVAPFPESPFRKLLRMENFAGAKPDYIVLSTGQTRLPSLSAHQRQQRRRDELDWRFPRHFLQRYPARSRQILPVRHYVHLAVGQVHSAPTLRLALAGRRERSGP